MLILLIFTIFLCLKSLYIISIVTFTFSLVHMLHLFHIFFSSLNARDQSQEHAHAKHALGCRAAPPDSLHLPDLRSPLASAFRWHGWQGRCMPVCYLRLFTFNVRIIKVRTFQMGSFNIMKLTTFT